MTQSTATEVRGAIVAGVESFMDAFRRGDREVYRVHNTNF
jgi:hypothetical protein